MACSRYYGQNEEYLHKVYQIEKGYFTNREVVAVFKRPDSVAIAWKQSITKEKGVFVAEMVLVERENRYFVDHTMVS